MTFNFTALRQEFPGKSPAELFDIGCTRDNNGYCWASVEWPAKATWMDMFANAPTSLRSH